MKEEPHPHVAVALGVVELETFSVQSAGIVERCPVKEQVALPVDKQFDPVGPGEDLVAVFGCFCKVQRIREARAPSAFYSHAYRVGINPLSLNKLQDLLLRLIQ